MRIGAGMQNKILEAMAIGKAVTTSSLAADGVGGVPGTHYCVADSPREEATAVLDLLQDDEKRKALGVQARQWIRKHHTWAVLTEIFVSEMRKSLEGEAGVFP
jgi:polysaccharide biosynthesis protein PslH